ncbi:MAG TPA: hypothetical protein VGC57_07025 [Cellulomonas sp.]
MAARRWLASTLVVGLAALAPTAVGPVAPAAAAPPDWEVLTSTTLPSQTADVAVDPARGVLYTSFTDEGVVRVLDEGTLAILTEIPVSTLPAVPRELAVDPVSGVVLATVSTISTSTPGEVAVIDPDTRSVVARVPVGINPLGVTISAVTRTAYVANTVITTPELTVLDLSTPTAPTVRGTIPLPAGAERVTESADGSVLYVVGSSTNAVWVVDAATGALLDTWTGLASPHQVMPSTAGDTAFVSVQGGTSAQIRATADGAVVGSIPVANTYYQAVDRGRDTVLMTAPFTDGGTVAVLDAGTGAVVQTLPVTSAHHITIDPVRGLAFVGSINSSRVLTVLRTALPPAPVVTQDPVDVVVDPGVDAGFTAAAAGSGPLTVQWQRSPDGGTTWSDVPGATGASYTLVGAVAGDSGALFRAVFTNPGGSATTAAARLTVNPALLPSLRVSSTVDTSEIVTGGTATIRVTARNLGPGAATGVLVRADLGDLLRVTSARAGVGTFDATTGTWTLGDLVAGAESTLTLVVQGVSAGMAAPQFTITSDVVDPAAVTSMVALVVVAPAPGDDGAVLAESGARATGPLGGVAGLLIGLGATLIVAARRAAAHG